VVAVDERIRARGLLAAAGRLASSVRTKAAPSTIIGLRVRAANRHTGPGRRANPAGSASRLDSKRAYVAADSRTNLRDRTRRGVSIIGKVRTREAQQSASSCRRTEPASTCRTAATRLSRSSTGHSDPYADQSRSVRLPWNIALPPDGKQIYFACGPLGGRRDGGSTRPGTTPPMLRHPYRKAPVGRDIRLDHGGVAE